MPNPAPPHNWIFRCIVAIVLAAHAFVLHSLTSEQAKPTAVPSAFSDTIFNTRTIELAPPPAQIPPLAPLQTAPVTARKKPAPRPTVMTKTVSTASAASVDANPTIDPTTDNLPANDVPKEQSRTNKMSDAIPVANQPAADAPEPATEPTPAPKQTPQPTRYAVPAPAILKYDIKGEIKGFSYFANGQLSWQHNGSNYDAQLEINHFLLGSRTQTSSGQIGARGLEPLRFADKARTEVVAQLDHSQKQVTFTADGTRTQLEDDAQDHLSIFLQLSALLAGNPERYKAGDRLAFQAVGSKSSEHWTFVVGSIESLKLPGGAVQALKLTRHPATEGAPKVEVWLATTMQFLPVRIRLMQGDGDFVEQQWRSITKPQ